MTDNISKDEYYKQVSYPQKYVLMTNEDGGNKFGNCKFTLKTSIKTGSKGLYRVIINEVLFRNSHSILTPNDYLNITLVSPTLFPTSMENAYTEKIYITKRYWDYLDSSRIIELITNAINNSATLKQYLTVISLPTTQDGFAFVGINGVEEIKIETSGNMAHIFNNLAKAIKSKKMTVDENDQTYPMVDIRNPLFGGPMVYMLRCNGKAVVPFTNENGMEFNISGISFNTTYQTPSLVQMTGSMEFIMANLSSFNVTLLDELGEEVNLSSPIYIQVTVEPFFD